MAHPLKRAATSALRRLGLRKDRPKRRRPEPSETYPAFMDGYLRGLLPHQGRLGIIQCGANDGLTVDPLARFIQDNMAAIDAVLIEPVPDVHDRLAARYANDANIVTLNTAIGPDGTIDLYRIKPAYAAHYKGIIASGITSFDREYVLGKAARLLDLDGVPPEERIERLSVTTTSITQVYTDHRDALGPAPLLQIDTEGFDDQVIYTIDFNVVRPIAIGYEFCHLGPDKLSALHSHLAAHGYHVLRWSKDDEIALRQG